jgi:hypothetical protein
MRNFISDEENACERRKEQGLVCNHHGMTIAERINEKANTLWTLVDKFCTIQTETAR